MREGESEIDDPRFFLSKNGKYDPKAELNATINALFNETRFDDNSTACLFPARKWWLEKELQIKNFPKVTCNEFDKTVERLSPKSATIVFPAAHINSPASMFGHTFLRINSHYKSKLLAYAVNYAAEADENRENAITFAVKGLFGGYYGKYSLLPYYEKLKEYRDREKRDIWEYDLNLSEDEVMKMVRHIWELNGIRSKYYFFTENCSYNMLWLIETARPSVHLKEHFTYHVIPLETIHAAKEEGLISDENYRPSKHTILLRYEELIDKKYIHYVQILQNRPQKSEEIVSSTEIPTQQKRYILEAAIELLEYNYAKSEMEKSEYLDIFYKLSKSRAALKRGDIVKIEDPQNPILSHRAAAFRVGTLHRSGKSYALFGFRPAYHTLEDGSFGFLRGTQIEFLNGNFFFDLNSFKVEELTILSITSISQRSDLIKPFSWRTKFGWDRNYLNDEAVFSAKVGAGLSWGNKYGYLYTMIDPILYATESNLAIDFSLGIVLDGFEKSSTVLEVSQKYYDSSTSQKILSFSYGYMLKQNAQLKLKYEYKQKPSSHITEDENSLKILLTLHY